MYGDNYEIVKFVRCLKLYGNWILLILTISGKLVTCWSNFCWQFRETVQLQRIAGKTTSMGLFQSGMCVLWCIHICNKPIEELYEVSYSFFFIVLVHHICEALWQKQTDGWEGIIKWTAMKFAFQCRLFHINRTLIGSHHIVVYTSHICRYQYV